MRTSEAHRYARWSAAMAVILAAMVAGTYFRRAYLTRLDKLAAPPPVPASIEERSSAFSISKANGDRTLFTIRASHTTEFKEGNRNLLEDVWVTIYGQKGLRNDNLHTHACEYIPSTGRITCAGNVQMDLQSAADAKRHPSLANGNASPGAEIIQVTTSNVTFDRDHGNVATGRPVAFRWPRGEGRAVGALYNTDKGTLELERNVEMTLGTPTDAAPPAAVPAAATAAAPPAEIAQPGHTPVTLTCDKLTFQHDEQTVRLRDNVHARQGTRELSSDEMFLYMDADLRVRHIVASGNPQLTDKKPESQVTLTADNFSALVSPEGAVQNVAAAGKVHGIRKSGSIEQELNAGRVEMDYAAKTNQPQLATVSEGVTLTSRDSGSRGTSRRLETQALEIHFAAGNRRRSARMEHVNTLSPATVQTHDPGSPADNRAEQTTEMRGDRMALAFDAVEHPSELKASGNVEVKRQVAGAPDQTTSSSDLSASFGGDGDWNTLDQSGNVKFRAGARLAQGDRAHLDHATNSAVISGSALLADASSQTTAQTITFWQVANELRAQGHVVTSELRAGTGAMTSLAPTPAHVSADELLADTAGGHAVYSRNARLWQGDSVIEGDTIELDSRVHILTATGHVRAIFPQAAWTPRPDMAALRPASAAPASAQELWRVRGGSLTYWDKESRARLEKDAFAESKEGSIQAETMDLFFGPSPQSASTRQLVRAVATYGVTVSQPGRRGKSERAEYTPADGKFVLSGGKPEIFDDLGNSTTGRQLTFFFADDRIVVDSDEGTRTVTLHRVGK